jgi:Spy/CpxP family protein refolding chaperone
MKRYGRLWLATMGAALAGALLDSAVQAAAPTSAPASAPASTQASAPATSQSQPAEKLELTGDYAEMVRELNLSDEQQGKIATKVKAKDDEIDAFDKANAEKVRALQQGLVQAHKDKDDALTKVTQDELESLAKSRRKLAVRNEADIQSVLTPEQRLSWRAFLLYRQAMAQYAALDLTERQARVLRNLAGRAVVKLEAAQGDKAATDKIYDDFFRSASERVLTDDQRAKLPKPATSPAGGTGQ